LIEESVGRKTREAKREVHHEVPRCLLGLRGMTDAYLELDGEGIQC
jgi:hypothetical protein